MNENRAVAQILIEEIGADGPEDAEVTARRAVEIIRRLRRANAAHAGDNAELLASCRDVLPGVESAHIGVVLGLWVGKRMLIVRQLRQGLTHAALVEVVCEGGAENVDAAVARVVEKMLNGDVA